MNQQYSNSDGLIKRAEGYNLKEWMFRIVRLWPWFIFSLFVTLSISYLYLRYASPVYQSVASLMVRDDSKGIANEDIYRLREMGLSNDSKLVVNEIEVLKSYDLIELVVDSLDLFVTAKREAQIKDIDIFGSDVPFIIEVKNPENIVETREWTVSYTGNEILFKSANDQQPTPLKYGQSYNSGGISFRFLPGNEFSVPQNYKTEKSPVVYKLYLNAPSETVIEYGSKLNVETANKLATVINLEIKDANRKRAKDFLQTLLFFYNQQGFENKNKVTENTIAFLNDRLAEVANELRAVEGSVEKYKSANRVTSLSADAELYLDASRQVDVQKAQVQTQLNIINALEQNLRSNQNNPQIVPSNFGIQDASLNQLIEKHNELVLQKERTEQKSGPKNPLLIDQINQIQELRNRLATNVQNLKKAYSISLGDISRKDAQLSNRIRNVPQLEKNLIQITRSRQVQEELYSYLLQKKEEAAVARASNIEDFQTIVKARDLGVVSPKPKIILAAGVLMGLILPVTFFGLRDFMNNKVGDRLQVEQHTDVPLLGVIPHVKKLKSSIVINAQSRTAVAEQLRNIRTSINFTARGKEVKTILVTSFQPGDGKSFVSLNLAASYALLNRKTVMLEFDLRRPHISKDMGLNGEKGISNILTGESQIDDLFTEIEGYDGNLFLLPAGDAASNPAELISSSKMSTLFKALHERFEHIVINTPPLGLVADASLLQQYADITLIILRQDHTSREVYSELKHRINKHTNIPAYLLLNDAGKRKHEYGVNGGNGKSKGYYA